VTCAAGEREGGQVLVLVLVLVLVVVLVHMLCVGKGCGV
jgi:hypothetical protein